MCKDPHLTFAYGGRADFRGIPGALYAFISSPGTLVNIRIRDAKYKLNGATINGTFIESLHVATRTALGHWFNLSVDASRLNANHYAWDFINGTCEQNRFVLGPHGRFNCDDLHVEIDYSSATIRAKGWEIDAMGQPVQNWLSGAKHRIDVGTALISNFKSKERPHGLVGQSFDGSNVPRYGRTDKYPKSGNFTTSAMAEGAIDGSEPDARVASPYAAEFKYSAMWKPQIVNYENYHRRLSEMVNSVCCQNCLAKKWKYCITSGPGDVQIKHDLRRAEAYTADDGTNSWNQAIDCHNDLTINGQRTSELNPNVDHTHDVNSGAVMQMHS